MSKKTNNMTLSTSILSESLSLFTPKDRAYNKAKKDYKDKNSCYIFTRKKKNRQINSLDELSKKFIKYALEANTTNINLNLMMRKIKAKKRIKLGPWDDEEDKILDEWVKKHGPQKWTKCAELIKERTGKQCREHWNNKLKSNLTKGNWTSEEDLLIMRFYVKYKSWKKIIPIFEDRAENSIKNRFFSQLRKIAVNKQDPENKEYGIKIKLNRLTQFIDEAYREAEDRYFNENKNMTKED